jgi:hypothetical protein
LLKQYVTRTQILRILSPDRQWESFLLLKLISCPFFHARSSGPSASTIAQLWCCLRSVGVISDINDVSLPDKRLAPRVLLRQDPFMALSESAARSFSVFRVSQVEQGAHSSKLMLRNCVLRHTLSPDVHARQDFECNRSDISQYWQRGTLVDPSAGDLVIVSTKSSIYWPFFVISSKHQHAWSRYALLQDPRNRPQTYGFDPSIRETIHEFVTSLSANERPCDWQEQFLLFLQRQPSDTQELFVRVSCFVVQME